MKKGSSALMVIVIFILTGIFITSAIYSKVYHGKIR
jgi:hypothetical protein